MSTSDHLPLRCCARTCLPASLGHQGQTRAVATLLAGALAACSNEAPVAELRPARYLALGQELTLRADGSRDPDGDALSFTWRLDGRPAGSRAALTADGAAARLTADVAGRYRVVVAVSDGQTSAGAALAVDGLSEAPRVPGALAGAHFGAALAAGDLDGDGFVEVIVSAPDRSDGGSDRLGSVTALRGGRHGLGPALWTILGAQAGDRLGASLASGDFNGDGFDDLALGAPEAGSARGLVLVIYGGPTADPDERRTTLLGPGPAADGDRLGFALVACDLDGDGYAELAAGVPGRAAGALAGAGAALIFRGGSQGLTDQAASSLSAPQPRANAAFGRALACGDLDGDGQADLLAGAPHEAVQVQLQAGMAYAFLGQPGALPSLAGTRAIGRSSPAAGELFGARVAVLGDVHGDGHAAFAVAAPGAAVGGVAGAGAIHIYRGGTAGPGGMPTQVVASAAPLHGGLALGVVCGPGDLDGDGYADLAVGSPTDTPAGNGALYLWRGSPAGLDLTAPLVLASDLSGARAGTSLASADLNGDGLPDLLVGAPWAASAAGAGAGAVLVFR